MVRGGSSLNCRTRGFGVIGGWSFCVGSSHQCPHLLCTSFLEEVNVYATSRYDVMYCTSQS
ncbi:hypothetical protein PAHAL_9G605300 [Panicum hallii]|uniref:Uncharacterized protein n=1 Tax=Panicum hallii TaxID=206008 RepID=A0A2T8I6F7_9POAL|nr:hypothetical protein PAHAL_9G605300 [Panicum hallii]